MNCPRSQACRATKTFITSRQPGDNYRAAATCLQYVLTDAPDGTPRQVTQSDADALSVKLNASQKYEPNGDFAQYQVPVVWSPMLTVWRKLHVEVDSMDQEPLDLSSRLFNNEWTNAYPSVVQPDVPATGFTTVHNNFGCTLCDLENRWEGGAFVTPSGSEFLIVRNTHTELILWGYPGNVVEQWCTIRDDDLFFPDPTTPRQLPQTSVLDANIVEAFRQAYVEIVEASSSQNVDNSASFQSNLHWTELNFDYSWGVGGSSHNFPVKS